MQLLIDTATENGRSLRVYAHVLMNLATALDDDGVPLPELNADTIAAAAPKGRPTPPPIRPVAPVGEPAPLPPGNVPPAPVQHPPLHPEGTPHVPAVPVDVPAGTIPDVDPATLGFGQGATAPVAPAAPNAAATVPTAPAAPIAGALPAGNSSPTTEQTAPVGNRDSAGIPWDARIHSDTRKLNADGTWRYRRNLDAAVKASVSTELKAVYGSQSQVPLSPQQPAAGVASGVPVPPAPASVPQQSVAAASVPVPPAPTTGDVSAPPAPVSLQPSNVLPFTGAVPVPPSASVGVPNAPQPGILPAPVTSFRDLMQKVNTALSQGRLTQAQLTEACKAAGVDSVTALASQPMLVPTVDEYLNRLGVAA